MRRGGWGRQVLQRLLLGVAALGLTGVAVAEPDATVLSIEGTVFVVRAGKSRPVIAAAGTELSKGDVVNSGRDSTARIRFADSAEVAIRPNSTLAIDEFRFVPAEPEADSLVLRLLKGGMRQVTGAISKRGNRDAYQLKALTATIGIRGTDFTLRICDAGECKADGPARGVVAESERAINNNPRPPAARVLSVSGTTTATEVTGVVRPLAAGAAIYSGDLIETDAAGPAALVFQDQTRVVIDRRSSFKVGSFTFRQEVPQDGNMVVELIKGGMRMVSGLIGKANAENVKINALTATIGIRGTNFDVLCAAAAATETDNPAPAQLEGQSCEEAVFAMTRDGAISLQVGDRPPVALAKDEVGVASRREPVPRRLDAVPEVFRQKLWPTPETLEVNMIAAFGEEGRNAQDAGLYLVVRDGEVLMAPAQTEPRTFVAGESGRMNPAGTGVVRYASTPSFLEQDWMLSDRILGFGVCRP